MKPTHGNWHKALWKLLTNPAIEILATLALVAVAAWVLLQDGAADPLPVLHFGRR